MDACITLDFADGTVCPAPLPDVGFCHSNQCVTCAPCLISDCDSGDGSGLGCNLTGVCQPCAVVGC
jgi:hypothetical protein